MHRICVYGTVFNNASTVEDSVKSVFDPSYDIVIVDSYSRDGTWEKLQKLKKEFNLTLLRLKSTRGRGRAYALEHCPDSSTTAYFDLDVRYNENFHKVLKSGLKELLVFGPILTYVQTKEEILRFGNWPDLNFGEDIEFLSRQQISLTFPLIIGQNEEVEVKNLFIEREKRYSKFWKIRIMKNIIDLYRGYNFTYRDLIDMYPYTKRYKAILLFLDIISRILGKHKNAYESNYAYLFRKIMITLRDPRNYINVDQKHTVVSLPRTVYNYLKKRDIVNEALIGNYILIT